MARVRSVDFLPEIFQTDTNRQFLAATLDQLIQEPKYKQTQGFIGRRVGPGVNPNDRYVVEPNKVKTDYQLEAGVVSLRPDTDKIKDVITYPGILDSVAFQGGDSSRPDRLFESQYYTWDPFVNWDTFINFSQYFWLPGGPAAVDVAATGVPATDNFVVNRANGVYTFSGLQGTNPTVDLVRGGSYTFQVAQNAKETVNYGVGNQGTSAYLIDLLPNPTLTLVRGNTYVFSISLEGAYPFYIKTAPTTGLTNIYDSGVTNNGAVAGAVTFVVPQDAPDTLYYAAANQGNMQGQLNIIDGEAGTGPGFWIQTAPGVSGRIPTTPNISSRDVYGVSNNGEDLGTVTFNVPTKTAQAFYYGLPDVGPVDLVTDLRFDQINNAEINQFLATYNGIDGITNLNGRTLIFSNTNTDTDLGGWYLDTRFDPLAQSTGNTGLDGSYDTQLYDQKLPVPVNERYSIWQISYVTNAGFTTIQLSSVQAVSNLEKMFVRYGDSYASTSWFKNDAGVFRRVPLLSAAQDTLYYQDGTDPEIFGRIRLIEQTQSSTLFIEEIVGKQAYTSPNGVAFTNGLKVVFRGDVEPASYVDQEYYVAGVGSAIELLPVGNFITPETYVVDDDDSTVATEPAELDYLTIDRASHDLNAWSRSNRWFHIDVINATAQYNNTEANIDNRYRAKRPIIEFRPGLRLYNMGTEGKQPVNVIDFSATDAFSNIQGRTATLLSSELTEGLTYRIVTLGTTDWNQVAGTAGQTYAVGDIVLVEQDGISGTGTALLTIDGFDIDPAAAGSRVIFAADQDQDVRNKIYVVEFITPDSVGPPYIDQPIINLVLADDGLVLLDQCTVCLDGNTLEGKTFWFDGATWTEAQQKTSVQQAPLYNVYDSNGISYSNLATYPSSTFQGTKLFSYATTDTGVLDPVLQFPLQYLNLNNVGDIVFENNLYKDTFLYVRDNVSASEFISNGFVREYSTRTVFTREIGWDVAATPTQIRQQFQFVYTGQPLLLDIQAQSVDLLPAVQVFVGSDFRDPDTYTVQTTATTTTITLDDTFVIGDVIEVLAISDQTSAVAFYQVPINLEKNPLNGNSDSFTLGTIRTHYESICQNLVTLTGPVNGANNTRDLGNIGPYGLIILQQSAPLTMAGFFSRSQDYNIFAALQYNSREYTKFKNLLLQEVTRLTINFQTPAELLTEAIANITAGRIESSPFYWSDMLPAGSVFVSNDYTYSLISTNVFDTQQVYDFTSANFQGLCVYKNDVLLTRGFDYVVATDGPRVTITASLTVGDVITIQEFAATYGSFVPNTPTKLGLYPAFRPELVTVKTTTGNAQVIVGHDGSYTPKFNDVRDDVLLEFERRIYSNLKLDGNPVPLTMDDVLPGQFRDTGYSFAEINSLLNIDFLSYVGWNKLDYTSQNYIANNELSYNYSGSTNKLNNQNLLGAWRGIYSYFYDTEDPSRTPWQMLGFSIKPTWWNTVYGAGPYTSDNLVLWDDLEAGLVADPAGSYILPQFARPGLSQVIPVNSEGQLLSPLNSVVGVYNFNTFEKSWSPGDGGPVQSSWVNSSSYPFAVMRVLALTRPAKFYSLFADRDLYRFNSEFGQYLYDNRYRLDANGVDVYGNGVSKASFINWIVDYNRQSGLDSTQDLQAELESLDVRLCYRMSSFSDKQYIKLYTEKSSPNSVNSTLQIPDESYDLLLYKNQPFDRTVYSSVVVQSVPGGYAVYGYSTTQPYFEILSSQAVGLLKTFSAGGVTVRVPSQYTDTVVQVPYGFVFSSVTSVCDFLLSYGELLSRQGFTFTDRANGYTLNWDQMVQEFLYWSKQGWQIGSLINLNPLAGRLVVTKPGAVADSISTQTNENVLLNQNKRELPTRSLNVVRLANSISMEPLTDETLSFADVKFTNYEHMIVLNNRSVFGDLIYEPVTGARQSRLNIVAINSAEWDGTVDAQGFILNQDNVEEWTGLKKYTKGQIVKYKDQYWSASKIVDPSPVFNFNDWLKSDYEQIEQGLLPNLANKADQLQTTYSVNVANLESDQDLLSYGLIGFRPRQYMAALNLDDTSQVNVYRQFLKTKGTVLSAELFKQANLGKESADYDIYENWAVQRAVYGANANRSFVELRLNRALLSSNPSLVQVVLPQQQSLADQPILLSNVWRQSYKLTSPDFLPTTNVTVTDTALPSAGYVNLEDVDVTAFSLDNLSTLNANLGLVKSGSVIWVAKVNNYDWNVYRAVAVPGYLDHVCDNLDGTSAATFSQQHGLTQGDNIVIKDFDQNLNGAYQVVSVVSPTTITIAYAFPQGQTVINGVGVVLTLQPERVRQASDISLLPYADELTTGTKVWVDDDGTGHWAVLEKQNVFSDVTELAPDILDATEQYGQSVAQATNRQAMLVGSPRYGFPAGTEKGAVYVYVKNFGDQYIPISPVPDTDAIFTLDATGVRGFGNAVDFGDQTWAAAGAKNSLGPGSEADVGYAAVIYRNPVLGEPGVNPYQQWQLLVPHSSGDRVLPGEFGHSVAVSADERWMYIGAPGINKVFAYGRVPWQDQFVQYVADGSTLAFSFANQIQINADTQLLVTLNGAVQTLTTNYTVSVAASTVTFVTAPAADVLVKIQRVNRRNMDGATYFNVTGTSGAGSGAEFTITRLRGTLPLIGLTSGGSGYPASSTAVITVPQASFGGSGAGSSTLQITVNTNAAGEAVSINGTPTWTPPSSLATVFSLNEYFFTVDNIYSFSLYANSVLQRPFIDYTFNSGTKDLTLTSTYLTTTAGVTLEVQAQSYFEYVAEITAAGLSAGDRFGHSVACTVDGRQVMIGTANQTVSSKTQAGSVYVFDRNVQKFIYNNDDSSTSITVLGSVTEPVSVIVNNQFLTNAVDGIVGANGTFTVAGNVITLEDPLFVGDVVEIETNQFDQVQQVVQSSVDDSGAAVQDPQEFVNFGSAVDICSYSCSLYTGAPQDSTVAWKAGSVQRNVNQSRVYGTTTSAAANPALTSGQTLRVNNMDVAVPSSWSSGSTYTTNTVVYNTVSTTTTFYRAVQSVPAATALTNTAYWQSVSSTTVAASIPVRALAAQINATVPNVTATVSSTGYLTIAVKNSAAAEPTNKLTVLPGSLGSVFDTLNFTTFVYTQSLYSPYPTEFAQFGAAVSIDDSAENLVVGSPTGTQYLIAIWDDGTVDWDANSTIFFSTEIQSGSAYTYDYLPSANETAANPGKFVFGLQITDSTVNSYDKFGVAVNYVDGVLVIGAPGNDFGDSGLANYGRVFVLENANREPAWTVLRTQQPVVDVRLLNGVFTYDRITSARTEFFDFFDPLQGKILGAARQNIDFISAYDPAQYNAGAAGTATTTWSDEHVGQIWWDISTVRFIDPNQDDIVYASRRWGQIFPGSMIDVYQWIQSTVPPTQYTGPGTPANINLFSAVTKLGVDGVFNTYYYFWVQGLTFAAADRGKTLSVETISRYIENPKSSGIPYIAALNASTIALYNAVDVIEAEDTIINIEFDREYTDNNVHVEYELIAQDKEDGWLSDGLYRKLQDSFCGVDTFGNLVPDINLNAAERYGVQFRPRQSMFADRFAALKNYLVRANTVLARFPISESRSFVLLNSSDPIPPATEIVGATTVVNYNKAVANLEVLGFQNINIVALGYKYLVATDSSNNGLWTIYEVQLGQGTMAGQRVLTLIRVQNYDTRRYWNYIDWYLPGYNSSTKVIAEVPNFSALATLNVPVGSSVRVTANAQGKFEIYLRNELSWERVGLEDGTIEFSAELWDYALGRFGFDVEVFDAQYFDQEPVIETRKIIQAINQELFVGDLLIERNRSLTLMFNYVLSEFTAPEWLVKTSLIDVDHRIRSLEPFQNFRQDNQEFVLDYIKEVKPYHVQIREFNLLYNGQDQYLGDVTDFDVPAYYNTSLPVPQYTSPILNISDPDSPYYEKPYFHATNNPGNNLSDADPGALIWSAWPYTQWFNNWPLTLESVTMIENGSGYTDVPNVTIVGDAEVPATAVALLNSQGQVIAVNLLTAGSGYRSTPTIEFDGGNGSGARAYAVMNMISVLNPDTGLYESRYSGLPRSFKTVIKYDRVQYETPVTDWTAGVTYAQGDLVRYNDLIWQASQTNTSAAFDLADWTEVSVGNLQLTYNAAEGYYTIVSGQPYILATSRTRGLYVPGVNEPGIDLPLLIDGIDYPGVQVYGRDYDSVQALDAIYSSQYSDIYLGTRYSDINVDGGQYIGPYEGHAPEELMNGSEFDTVDIRVYTRPGSDWSLYDGVAGYDGHGFQIANLRAPVTTSPSATFTWQGIVEHPFSLVVSNVTTGRDLANTIDYTVNWLAGTVTVNTAALHDIINITVYELGGGSQLYRETLPGNGTDELIIPVQASEIYQIALFVNGVETNVVDWEAYYPGTAWNILQGYDRLAVVFVTGPTTYYRAIQTVPAGIAITNTDYWQAFVPGQLSKVTLPAAATTSDLVVLCAMGITSPIQYSWSTALTENFVVDATINSTRTVTLNNSVSGTNPANMIVTVAGQRLRPYEGREHIGDGTTNSFGLPQRGGYSQAIINPATDITVYVDGVLKTQNIGSGGDYSVTPYPGNNDPGMQVVFASVPAPGAQILIAVSTVAEYLVSGNLVQLVNAPPIGDTLSVTTWNDLSQQNALTLVFQGPVETGFTVIEPYDSTGFDDGVSSGAPGSFDYSAGSTIPNNNFDLQRVGVNASRLWVTLNGNRLFDGEDFTVSGQYLILGSGPIAASDVMVITEFTESIVPEAMAFRIFQDMRGVQATYRITPDTSTALAADVSAAADTIQLVDASHLSEPDLPNGVFGICTIQGERIMYRVRDTAANTISGLMRGTAGTAASAHPAGAAVYDMGRGNLLYSQYQDTVVKDTSLGDGSSLLFAAPSIDLTPADPRDSSTEYIDDSIEVYVGGIRQYAITQTDTPSQYRYTVSNVSPCVIEFIGDAPAAGAEVAICQRRALSWYQTGSDIAVTDIVVGNSYYISNLGNTNWLAIGAEDSRVGVLFTATAVGTGSGLVTTASDGVALQETETQAARFLRGL